MSSSATGSTERNAGGAADQCPVTLDRTVARLDQGIVVTYELTGGADAPVTIDLTQVLPEEVATADVGFRTDAAPSEWSVEEETVRGTGTVPEDGTVEYVLGLKLPEAPEHLPTFPETAVTGAEAEGTDAATTEDDPEAGEPDADGDDRSLDGGTDDGPALVGNTDGALAESVRQVIGSDTDDGAGASGPAATDGGRETPDTDESGATPAPRGTPEDADSGLEAAVAAVESELEDGSDRAFDAGDDTDADADVEPPELDLEAPDAAEAGDDGVDAGTDGGAASSTAGGDDQPAAETATAGVELDALADRLAAADEAERRALRDALGLETGAAPGDHSEAVAVRLEHVESRLSAFEAYEDALAEFIEDTGTVASVEETATEAAAAAEDLRSEVAALREEVEAAAEHRETLREEVAALRADVEEARGLRQQLLGALQTPGATDGTVAEDASVAGPPDEADVQCDD